MPPNTSPPLRIDYLARDYTALRQMLLDRMSVQIPTWTERHEADLEVALVELLAYTGDYLSYYQDAVAAEAYLFTARQRISLRRHARMLDYTIDSGLNARVLVHVETAVDGVVVPAGTSLLAATFSDRPALPASVLDSYPGTVFQTMAAATLYRASHSMVVEPEAAGEWSLLPGRAHAHLRGNMTHLRVGDFVRLHTVEPGNEKSHVVRLIQPPALVASPLGREATLVAWSRQETLPEIFPVTHRSATGELQPDRCRAQANLLLADEGRTLDQTLPPVPAEGEYHPRLLFSSIAHAAPLPQGSDADGMTAAEFLQQDAQKARALITLTEQVSGNDTGGTPAMLERSRWNSCRDLLASSRFARDFVAEIDNDGHPVLRFGDNTYGRRPRPGTAFRASCRVGQGSAGNIGSGVLRHIVLDSPYIMSVTNPLAASGGTDPELTERIRTDAPEYFRKVQHRCITASDYRDVLRRLPGTAQVRARIQQAAEFAETAPWFRQIFLYAEPAAAGESWTEFSRRCMEYILPFARIGDSLKLLQPPVTEIDLHLSLRIAAGYAKGAVRRQVLLALERAVEASEFDFDQQVYAATWVSVAAAIPGVEAARAVHVYSANSARTGPPTVSSVDVPASPGRFAFIREIFVETHA